MSPTPRAEAIDSAWRRFGPGPGPWSAPDGGPLSRTVKLVVLPLVLRPSRNRELAATVLDDGGSALVDQLMAEHRHQLRAAATWFVVLVQHLAARPQDEVSRDSCYPKAFELAVRHGDPEPGTADPVAVDALDELAETRGGRTSATVRQALADPHLRSALSDRLASGWGEEPARGTETPDETDCLRFLDCFTSRPLGGAERRAAEDAWTAIVGAGIGQQTGRGLRTDRWPTALPEPARARQLGLTGAETPRRPLLDQDAGTSQARFPWDRSIVERVLNVLKHSSDRTTLPGLADLLAEEVDRACRPWEVLDESSRAMLVLGTVLVLGLGEVDRVGARTQAHRIVAGMRRRESWLAWAQRQPSVPGRSGTDPETASGALVTLGTELADPVGPYLRRLWARLHGAETRDRLPVGAEEVQSLLLGVFRSVLLDGRSRIRAALTRLEAR